MDDEEKCVWMMWGFLPVLVVILLATLFWVYVMPSDCAETPNDNQIFGCSRYWIKNNDSCVTYGFCRSDGGVNEYVFCDSSETEKFSSYTSGDEREGSIVSWEENITILQRLSILNKSPDLNSTYCIRRDGNITCQRPFNESLRGYFREERNGEEIGHLECSKLELYQDGWCYRLKTQYCEEDSGILLGVFDDWCFGRELVGKDILWINFNSTINITYPNYTTQTVGEWYMNGSELCIVEGNETYCGEIIQEDWWK